MIRYYCDRCKVEMTAEVAANVRICDTAHRDNLGYPLLINLILCDKCLENVIAYAKESKV